MFLTVPNKYIVGKINSIIRANNALTRFCAWQYLIPDTFSSPVPFTIFAHGVDQYERYLNTSFMHADTHTQTGTHACTHEQAHVLMHMNKS